MGKLKFLPHFFTFILCIELAGNYLHKIKFANFILYNFSIPLEYLFYILLFWLQGGNVLKKISRLSGFIFIAITLLYFIYLPLKDFHNNVLLGGQIIVIVCCCTYFVQLFNANEETSLLQNYFFWLSSGLLLFNLGDFVYSMLYPLIHNKGWDKFDFLFKSVNNNLLLLLYLSYIISIFMYKKKIIMNA